MYFVAELDHGILRGPYPSFDAADDHVQSVQACIAWIADETGWPHPDLDPALREEIEDEVLAAGDSDEIKNLVVEPA